MTKLFWLFPIWFLIDNILGLNGYHFTVFGVGIRIILFALSAVSLFLYCLYTVKTQRICIGKRKAGYHHLLDYCRPLDGFVLGFLILNFIWASVVPLLKNGSLSYALNDFNTLLVLVLYFPCAFLIRTSRLTFRAICRWLFPLLLLLSVWHCVMYIGEIRSPGFYAGYYDLIDIISFGTAVRSDVVMGYGITRIIQVTSIFLIPAFLLILEKSVTHRKPGIVAVTALVLFAVLITYTKSIWFGLLTGLIVAIAGIALFAKDAFTRKRTAIFSLALVVFFCIFNYGFLDNTIVTRTLNNVHPNMLTSIESQIGNLQQQLNQLETGNPTDSSELNENDSSKPSDKEDLENLLKKLESQRQDAAGTAAANAERSLQNSILQKKWSQSKLFGFGYGAYAEDCIRNQQVPYMYESLIPAMLMKLGLAGMLVWGIFVLALVVFAIKAMWKNPVKFWCWIGTALAYAMAVQTNPFLFTFAGISLMLYLLLFIVDQQEETESK